MRNNPHPELASLLRLNLSHGILENLHDVSPNLRAAPTGKENHVAHDVVEVLDNPEIILPLALFGSVPSLHPRPVSRDPATSRAEPGISPAHELAFAVLTLRHQTQDRNQHVCNDHHHRGPGADGP